MEDSPPRTLVPRRGTGPAWASLAVAALLGVLFAAWLAWRIPQGTLLNTDELLTAERSREMSLPSGSPWLVQLNFQPSFSKPPLQYWLTAPTLRLHVSRETAVRLWPSIYAVLAVLATGWLARVLDPRRPWSAPLSMALLAACPLVLAEAGRALLDVGLTLFVTLTVGAVLRARQTRAVGWLVVAGVACWLATLQKNPLGLLCWLLLAVAGWMMPPRTAADVSWRRREAAAFLLVALAAMAWPLLQLLTRGMAPGDLFGWAEAARLRGQSRLGKRGYFEILNRVVTCWAWGLPVLLAAAWPVLSWFRRGQREPGEDRPAEGDAVAVAVLCLGFLGLATLGSFRSVRYVLPIIPCLCVLLARALHRVLDAGHRGRRALAVATAMALAAVDFHHAYDNYADWVAKAPDQQAMASLLGETYRKAGQGSRIVLVRASTDGDGDSRQSLLEWFFLFYGGLPVPVESRSVEQLRGEAPSRRPAMGICRERDWAGLRGVLTGTRIDGRRGDFILWEIASPE